ncbi:CASP-like protein 4A3 isoform X1 [Diospyros lotus]|uniref:CASP-like protein 4A3 isoform X1 n=1 Tax=Diospyros lotus TaxID=55363 RepID=UPI00225B1DD5|nr:CASP-like protein 4A3 isoform X1 [Diospyros lotus]
MDNRESSRSKRSSNRSMSSDTDSQMDTFHSPLRSESPLRSDDPDPPPDKSPAKSPSKAIVAFDKYYSPLRSPNYGHKAVNAPLPPPPPVMVFNRAVKEDVPSGVTKLGPAGGGGEDGDLEDGDGGVGGERRSRAAVAAILRRTRREMMLQRAELGFRVCEMLLCLISFSVMAADKTQGWSGDSFDRYKEYRYCVAVNVIGFVYSGFQACDLAYNLITGKSFIMHHLRYHFDFAMDQILAYLLISASSSAATRVDDWVSNWGKDEFTEMASASVGMSFVAFVAFAISSLICGYNLFSHSMA